MYAKMQKLKKILKNPRRRSLIFAFMLVWYAKTSSGSRPHSSFSVHIMTGTNHAQVTPFASSSRMLWIEPAGVGEETRATAPPEVKLKIWKRFSLPDFSSTYKLPSLGGFLVFWCCLLWIEPHRGPLICGTFENIVRYSPNSFPIHFICGYFPKQSTTRRCTLNALRLLAQRNNGETMSKAGQGDIRRSFSHTGITAVRFCGERMIHDYKTINERSIKCKTEFLPAWQPQQGGRWLQAITGTCTDEEITAKFAPSKNVWGGGEELGTAVVKWRDILRARGCRVFALWQEVSSLHVHCVQLINLGIAVAILPL